MILYPLHHVVEAYQHFDSFEKSCALKVEAFYDWVEEVANNITVVHQWQPALNEAAANLEGKVTPPQRKNINDTTFIQLAYAIIQRRQNNSLVLHLTIPRNFHIPQKHGKILIFFITYLSINILHLLQIK